MSRRSLWGKLYATFALLGFINILLAFGFYYYSSTQLIQERAAEQMASVRESASHKLKLYLDHLKNLATQSSGKIEIKNENIRQSLHAVFVLEDKNIRRIFGGDIITHVDLADVRDNSFTTFGNSHFLLKVDHVVWIFNNKGLNAVLDQREGLGETGEIYIVGEDFKIKSASRLLKDWKDVIVNNESIRLGKLDKFGVHSVKDYRGVDVVSSYSNFTYDQLRFVLLSEIDKVEVFKPLNHLFPKILLLCSILLLISLGISFVSSKKIIDLIEVMRHQINSFNFKIINAQEEEKRKMSLTLHDGIGQTLSALKWGLTQVISIAEEEKRKEKMKELLTLCDDSISEVRNVSNDLMPSTLNELGCFKAIKQYLLKQEKYLGIKIDYWYGENLEQCEFKEGIAVNIYRMIQEFVQNSFKHASATYMSLVLFKQEGDLVIRFEDNGIGMDSSFPMPRTIKYRTELMGGTMERSYDTNAMIFQIHLPLKSVFKNE